MQLTVEPELAHGGEAIARVDGRVIFVEGAAPGETVEAEVTHRRKDFWRAQTRAVLAPSPDRVAPPCPYYGACGGCQVQHLAYAVQLAQKRRVLHHQLLRARLAWAEEEIQVLGMDDPWRYRLRGEFHVLHQAGQARIGFYRKHTYQTLPIEACLIHAETIERALPAFAAASGHEAARRVQAIQLTWAPGTRDLLWAPYPPGSADPAFGARAAAVAPDLNLNDDSIGIEDQGRHFRVRPEAFVQVNWRMRDTLYATAVRFAALGPGDRVVDAYAGIGMLSARLADRAAEVVCLEESPYSVRLGELNMQLNGCPHVRYRRGKVEATLASVDPPVAAVVLDPPRAGCAEGTIAAIRALHPERVVYVSCEPSTLARDVARLCAEETFRLSEVVLVDMFPQTYHIEAVVKLERP
ncbi:MAG TPA: class I SAM-dependent RNA methyltransferase [Candidatus Limnocylindrales bacterium]|nr:class I SAM-dependent RNA methyltransferase [Candidatus Limnocylindrales bacterium]